VRGLVLGVSEGQSRENAQGLVHVVVCHRKKGEEEESKQSP